MLETVFRTENIFCLFGLLIGLMGSFLLVPPAKKLAHACDCIDRPDGRRKLHGYPVAYFGGLAILGGFVLSALLLSLFVMGTIPRQIAVLIIGGIAMNFAKISRPASGMEHYISHVWDMRGLSMGTPVETHGVQCAIGTLYTAKLYEMLKSVTPDKEKALRYVEGFEVEQWYQELSAFMGSGADAMIALDKKEQKYD